MQTTAQPRVLSWAFELAYLELSASARSSIAAPAAGTPRGSYVAARGGALCRLRLRRALRFELARSRPHDRGHAHLRPTLSSACASPSPRRQVQRLIRDHIRYHLGLNPQRAVRRGPAGGGGRRTLARWRRRRGRRCPMTNEEIAQKPSRSRNCSGRGRQRLPHPQLRAARRSGLGEEKAVLRHAEGGLRGHPRIGEAIAQKIGLLDTGELTCLRDLLAKYPEGFLELLRIPGPKRARLPRAGCGSVDELEACIRGQVRGSGMGAKSGKARDAIANAGRAVSGARGDMLPRAERSWPSCAASMRCMRPRRLRPPRRDRRRPRRARRSGDPRAVCRAFAASGLLAEVALAGDTRSAAAAGRAAG